MKFEYALEPWEFGRYGQKLVTAVTSYLDEDLCGQTRAVHYKYDFFTGRSKQLQINPDYRESGIIKADIERYGVLHDQGGADPLFASAFFAQPYDYYKVQRARQVEAYAVLIDHFVTGRLTGEIDGDDDGVAAFELNHHKAIDMHGRIAGDGDGRVVPRLMVEISSDAPFMHAIGASALDELEGVANVLDEFGLSQIRRRAGTKNVFGKKVAPQDVAGLYLRNRDLILEPHEFYLVWSNIACNTDIDAGRQQLLSKRIQRHLNAA